MVLLWTEALASTLETNLSKLNILDLVGFVSEYRTKRLPSLISAGKHAFTDTSWKIWSTLMSSIPSYRKRILQAFVAASLLALITVVLNILYLVISRARECHWNWNYIKFLSSFRLFWRKITAFLRLCLFITTEMVFQRNSSREKVLLFLWVFLSENLFCFIGVILLLINTWV